MDYDHVFTNSAGCSSPTFGSNFPHAPPFYPEPYPRRNSLFVNAPTFKTPDCSRILNFAPKQYPPCAINQNERYKPYQPCFTSFQKSDDRRSKACQDGPCVPDIKNKFSGCQQKLHSNAGKGNCAGINNHFKTNVKRKREKNKKNRIEGHFSALPVYNYQSNCGANIYNNNQRQNYADNALYNNNNQKNDAAITFHNNCHLNYPVDTIDDNLKGNYAANAIHNNRHSNYSVNIMDNSCKVNYAVNAIHNNRQEIYAVNTVDNKWKGNSTDNSTAITFHNNCYSNYPGNITDNNLKANFAVNIVDNNCQENYAVNAIDNNRQENYAANSIDSNLQEIFSANAVDNSWQGNSTDNPTIQYVPNKEVLLKVKEENDCEKFLITNEQKSETGKDRLYEDIIGANTNSTKPCLSYANGIENMNFTSTNIGLNPRYQNDLPVNHVTHSLGSSTDLVFADALTNADISTSLQSMGNIDLSGCRVAHMTIPENVNSYAHDKQNISENTDIESSFFKQIFEGKDENGEDIVILLADSDMQEIIKNEIITDKFAYNGNLNTGIDQDAALDCTENNAGNGPTSSEFHFDTQLIKPNDHNQDMFISHIDDYASEETVTTSKTPISKKSKTNSDINAVRNQETTTRQTSVAKDAIKGSGSEPSTSGKIEKVYRKESQSVNSSRKKFNSRKRNQGWKRSFQWKSNDPLSKIQRQYFGRFMKRAKFENKLLMTDERFWNMYRVIVNRVGGNVMQILYKMLPALIYHYGSSKAKSNVTASKSRKKYLQVKLPAKPKKRDNNENN